jgi:hypothetical protein
MDNVGGTQKVSHGEARSTDVCFVFAGSIPATPISITQRRRMAKSAENRAEAGRILANWILDTKLHRDTFKLPSLSVGRVFKQDPWDCGVPRCGYCSPRYGKRDRQSLRKEERAALDLQEES